jgi:formylglycine-generating enzyme required for sulfatase activity
VTRFLELKPDHETGHELLARLKQRQSRAAAAKRPEGDEHELQGGDEEQPVDRHSEFGSDDAAYEDEYQRERETYPVAMRRRKRSTTWRQVARSGRARLVFGLIIVGVLGVTFWPQQSQQSVPSQVGQSIDNGNTKVALSPAPAVAPFDATQAKSHQKSWADHLGVSVETTNSIGMKFVVIPPGEFMMGSSEDEPGHSSNETLHKVTLTQPFQLGMYEVTQEQYQRVMLRNPSKYKDASNPVGEMTWITAVSFCATLSQLPEEKAADRIYRLPTEAEWEYACRAGTTTAYSFGDNVSLLGEYAWFANNADNRTHPVGQKKPNGWGLYDMHGNATEWCQDWKADYPSGAVTDPVGPSSGTARIDRSGHPHSSWSISTCRSAWRGGTPPGLKSGDLGFRVVYTIAKSVDSAIKAKPSNELVPQSSTLPPIAVAPFNATQAKAHQKSWADHLGVTVETTNSIGMKFVVIPPGEFMMGSPEDEPGRQDDETLHKVTLTKAFELGVYEVTQEQYEKVMGTNPSSFKGPQNPVEQVTWSDAVAFCKLLSDLPEEKASGYVYRLPTEAEWEHACRAGTTSDYSYGDSDAQLGDYAWYNETSGGTSHPVGLKKPNPWGLYDMHGNVREWCFNGLHAYPIRVQRGAGWNAPVDMARSSYRGRYLIRYRANDHGFRVVRLKTNSGSDLKASSLDMPQQPIRVDLLQRIHSIQGSLHQDWQKQADGTITANVKANHDITSVPVDDLISTSPYGLVIDLGNVGRRTGVPRFSIKCPYSDTKRIIVNYYYGRTYNLSVGVEGAGSISTRQFLGYRALAIHVTDQYVEASLNGQVFGRIAHERGDQPTKQENAKIEFSGISGSWMHFHIRSAKLLLNPPIDGL